MQQFDQQICQCRLNHMIGEKLSIVAGVVFIWAELDKQQIDTKKIVAKFLFLPCQMFTIGKSIVILESPYNQWSDVLRINLQLKNSPSQEQEGQTRPVNHNLASNWRENVLETLFVSLCRFLPVVYYDAYWQSSKICIKEFQRITFELFQMVIF